MVRVLAFAAKLANRAEVRLGNFDCVEVHFGPILVQPVRWLAFHQPHEVRVVLFVVHQVLLVERSHIIDRHHQIELRFLFTPHLHDVVVPIDVLADEGELDMLEGPRKQALYQMLVHYFAIGHCGGQFNE